MPHESDFAGAQAKLFPHQAHQPIALRAAACVTVSAGGEDQADVLRGSNVVRNRTSDLIGESLDHQRMRRVDVVVVNGELRMRTPRLTDGMSDRLALQQIEDRARWAARRFLGRRRKRLQTIVCRWKPGRQPARKPRSIGRLAAHRARVSPRSRSVARMNAGVSAVSRRSGRAWSWRPARPPSRARRPAR